MAADVQVRLTGVEEMTRRLQSLVPKLRVRALRNALAAGARVVRDEARRRAPVLQTSTPSGASALRRGVRKPGTVRDAIVVRTSKVARRAGDVGVFVNVRPARGATRTRASQRGAKNPNDPYYWRFLEFGWDRKPQGYGFLQAGAQRLGEALRRFQATLGPQLAKFDASGGKHL